MQEFARHPTERRVKAGAGQAKNTFVLDLTKRLRVSSARRLNGVKVAQDIAKAIVDSYAGAANNSIVNSGKAAFPNFGSSQLQMRERRSREHIGQAKSYSGGAGFL